MLVLYQTIGLSAAKYSLAGLPGDHIRKVTPVPFPNTVVKLSEPMIVPTSVKVGIAGFLKSSSCFDNWGFFRFYSRWLRLLLVSRDFVAVRLCAIPGFPKVGLFVSDFEQQLA